MRKYQKFTKSTIEVIIKKVLSGMTLSAISSEMNLNKSSLYNLSKTSKFKTIYKRLSNDKNQKMDEMDKHGEIDKPGEIVPYENKKGVGIYDILNSYVMKELNKTSYLSELLTNVPIADPDDALAISTAWENLQRSFSRLFAALNTGTALYLFHIEKDQYTKAQALAEEFLKDKESVKHLIDYSKFFDIARENDKNLK